MTSKGSHVNRDLSLSKCHIKQLKSGKSCKTCLTNHSWSIYITPYATALGGGHKDTQTHTDMQTKEPGTCQPRALGLKIFSKIHNDFYKNQANVGHNAPGTLKLLWFTHQYMCVCLCVRPKGINNQWCDINCVQLVKQVLQLFTALSCFNGTLKTT